MTKLSSEAGAATTQPDVQEALGVRLVTNTAINVAGQLILLAVLLGATPYLVHGLGAERYGVLILLLTYIEVFSWVDVGVTASVIKTLAQLLARQRYEEIQVFLGTALTMVTAVGLCLGVGLAVSAETLMSALGTTSSEVAEETIRTGFWLASATFVVRFVGQVIVAVPIAAEQFRMANIIAVGTEVLRLVGAVAAVTLGYSLEGVMISALVAAVTAVLLHAAYAARIVPGLSWRPSWSVAHARAIARFSGYVVVANTSGRVLHAIDKVLLGHFVTASAVAFYAVPYSVCQRLGSVAVNVTSVVFPAASGLSAAPGDPRLRELYVRSSKIVAAAVAFPAIVLCVLGRELLAHWIDADFAAEGRLALQLLSMAFLINTLGYVPYIVSQAIGHPELSARFAGLNAALAAGLFLVLIPLWGGGGAALGLLLAQVIVIPCFVVTVSWRLGVEVREMLTGAFGPVAVAGGLLAVILLVLQPWISSPMTVGLATGLALAGYVVLIVLWVLDEKERVACRAAIWPRRWPLPTDRPAHT